MNVIYIGLRPNRCRNVWKPSQEGMYHLCCLQWQIRDSVLSANMVLILHKECNIIQERILRNCRHKGLLGKPVVQLPSPAQLCDPMDCKCQASLSLTVSWSLPKFLSIASAMPSSHFILWNPLLLLPSIFPSIRDFSNESAVCIKWPKYWSFRSSEYSGLIFLKIDYFDFFAVQGALRNLLQHRNSKTSSIPWCSAFFTVQLS